MFVSFFSRDRCSICFVELLHLLFLLLVLPGELSSMAFCVLQVDIPTGVMVDPLRFLYRCTFDKLNYILLYTFALKEQIEGENGTKSLANPEKKYVAKSFYPWFRPPGLSVQLKLGSVHPSLLPFFSC